MENVMQKAELLLSKNEEAIKRVETDACNIGCQFCANCSGIVGG